MDLGRISTANHVPPDPFPLNSNESKLPENKRPAIDPEKKELWDRIQRNFDDTVAKLRHKNKEGPSEPPN